MNSASDNSMIMGNLLDSAQGATSTNRQKSVVVSGPMINVNNAEKDIEGLNSYLGNSLTTLHWIHS